MSAVMHFVASRSLFREVGLWTNLSDSYSNRNNIIHGGASATQAEASLALSVAKRVIAIMDAI